jgi:hypothetical protein
VYELAARKRAFARPSAAETMAAIIRDDAEPLPQRLWKSIAPPDGLAVAEIRQVRIAPDCRSVAWSVEAQEHRLFLMKGLGF